MEHTTKKETAATTHKAESAETPKKAKAATSSKGVRRAMQVDRRATRSVRRVTKALDKAVETYTTRRDKSKAARKDGVITDFAENMAASAAKAISTAAPLIHDAAELVNTVAFRKQIRRAAKTFSGIPFVS